MKKPFTDKERDLLHKSRVAKVLAQAAFDHSLTFYEIRRAINDDEMFSLIFYHNAGIVINAVQDKSKAYDVNLAWQEYTPTYAHYCERDNFDWDYYDQYYLNDYLPRMYNFAKDKDYWEQYDVLKDSVDMTNYINTECEIQEYEKLLANETLDWGPTDNDIAVETYKEMCRVDKIRQLAISAYNKGINTLTVIRFMNEKLANDAERGIFLEQYASAGFWDGFDTDSDY